MLLLYLRSLILVQFLHGITAVHKTDDEATLDYLRSQLTVVEFALYWKKNGWQFRLRVRNTSLNLRELSPDRKSNFNRTLSQILAFSSWL